MNSRWNNISMILLAGCLLTGCSSAMKSGLTGRSLVDHLPIGHSSNVSPAERESIEMLFGMARVAERNGRSTQAVEAYREILADQPGHSPSLHRLGVVAARQGRIDEAMDYFIAAVGDGEPSAELLGDIGYTQYLANDLDAAANTLQKAIYKEPNNKRIINNLAIVMGMQQRFDDSLDLFRQTGSEAESLAGVAFTQAQTGQLVQAKATYHRSLEVDSSLDVAANGLVELQRAAKTQVQSVNADTELAGRSGINISFPGAAGHADEKQNHVAGKSRELVKSFAAVVRPKPNSTTRQSKISKPPVIAMPPAETSVASVDAPHKQYSTAESQEIHAAQTGSTARIVMAPPTSVPVAQHPPVNFSPVATDVRRELDPARVVQAGPSSRRSSTNPTEPSFVRQVEYDEPIGPAPSR